MTVDRVISNGTLVTSEEMLNASVAVDEGQIVAIGEEDTMPEASTYTDASGLLVMPGIVDPHVHIDGSLSIDSYETGTKAAALGGITSIINFAWQTWDGRQVRNASDSVWRNEGSLIDAVSRQQSKANGSLVDYGFHATVTAEDPAVFDEFSELVEMGIPSFKFFTVYDIAISNGFLRRSFEELSELDAVAVLHTEDDSICEDLTDELQTDGKGEAVDYPESRPVYAEAIQANAATRLANEVECKYYGIHTSSKEAASVIEEAQEDGSLVRGETCVHYTTLTEDAYEDQGNLAILSPPLRADKDVDAMFKQLRDGALSVVSTDHVASLKKDKLTENWWDCPFGANSLQTSLPVFHDEAINQRGFSYQFLVRTMSTNPAKTFGFSNKGRLTVGADADIVVFDPEETYTISADQNASVADYSVYEGRTVTGRVKQTYVRGELIVDDGEIVGEEGHGKFVKRDIPDWRE